MNVELEIDFVAALALAEPSLSQVQRDLLVAMYVALTDEVAAGELAPLLGVKHHAQLNLAIAGVGKALAKAAGIEPPKRSDGTSRWWQIVATGRTVDQTFLWKLRPQLREAVRICGLVASKANVFPEVVSEGELYEGAAVQVTVNAFERNPVARRRCIEHYGTQCCICGFDFGQVYGPIAEGVIHVHHLRPLSRREGRQLAVDPIEDLRPVCANCHLVVHRRDPPLTIEEVQSLLAH